MSERFEDKISVINEMIEKKRSSWRLSSLSWMDFDDIKQKILIHIHLKWNQWDQTKKLEPWLGRLISNQIKNALRDNYYVHARPCLRCAAGSADSCSLFGKQCSKCPLFESWEKKKSQKHEISMAHSIYSEESCESYIKPLLDNPEIDYPKLLKSLSKRIRKELGLEAYYTFNMIYIDNMPEAKVGAKLKMVADSSGRYAKIDKLKIKFKNILKDLIRDEGIL